MQIESYQCPPIYASTQYFKLAEQLADKLKADEEIMGKYPTKENEITFKRNLLIYHCLVADGTVMNASLSERNLRNQEDGWFIWLQNYTLTTSYPYKNNDELYTYWFDKFFDDVFDESWGGRYLKECIANYKSGQYYSCVCGLFPLIELIERRISKFDGESVFNIKKALNESQVKNLSGYKKYFEEFESNLNTFLKDNLYAVSAETEEEPKFICRNRILHGILTRDINKTDCLKLFCIVKSMAQFEDWLHSLEEIKRLRAELK